MLVTETTGFEDFFRLQHPKLVALGMAMSGSREAGKDLAQEALLRTFRNWPTVSRYDNPAAWVRRVLINLTTDTRRRSASERDALARLAPSEPMLVPDRIADDWWKAVLALPQRQRAAVALHYLDDLSVTEVAGILGVTNGTIKASLSHARAHLATALDATSRTQEPR